MHILFYDPLTPQPYDLKTLQQKGLGGTEATVLRVAKALGDHHDISIAQQGRQPQHNLSHEGINYLALETAHRLSPDIVILLRNYRLLESIGSCYPQARKFLWLHNMPSTNLYAAQTLLLEHQFHLLAVSHFHQKAIEKRLQGKWFQQLLNPKKRAQKVPISVIYNPIDEHLNPDQTPWKADQLLFMSSPQKGLRETLQSFEKLCHHYPEYQLLIANPGYYHTHIHLPPQAKYLGSLPHPQLIQYLRESFCVFYPQHVRVETFGLVYAEANAVGTPVLAHDAGAAAEVLSDPEQLIQGNSFATILEKITRWRKQRPILKAQAQFRISKIKEEWLKLLQST